MVEDIRMFMKNGEIYLHRDDVIKLIEKVSAKPRSLSSRECLKEVILALDCGQLDMTSIKKKRKEIIKNGSEKQ